MGTVGQYEIDLSAAERILTQHLACLGGQSVDHQAQNRVPCRQFLADLCELRGQPPTSRLVLDERRLLNWMIRDAAARPATKACKRLAAVRRYWQALARSGLVATDLMAEFKARHGNRRWEVLIPALQAPDPAAALAALRVEALPPGPLATHVQPYLELHQALGKDYRPQGSILRHLDCFLQAHAVRSYQAITAEIIERWADTTIGNAATRIVKARAAHRFFDHLLGLGVVRRNPVSPVLLSIGRLPRNPFKPFLFTTEQVAAILAKARQLPRNSRFPLCAQTCTTVFGLLYALGLRIGEACRLRVRDLDQSGAVLFIDQTKFYKSRYVPFGPKVGHCLQEFVEVRRTLRPPLQDDDYLFVALGPGSVAQTCLGDAFRRILNTLGIEGLPGLGSPRLHSLRHTFAVHRLLRWYREGVDVQSRLPALSTFLGHVDPKCTQIYLTMTADLLQEANTRFHRHFGSVFDDEVRE